MYRGSQVKIGGLVTVISSSYIWDSSGEQLSRIVGSAKEKDIYTIIDKSTHELRLLRHDGLIGWVKKGHVHEIG